MPTPPKIPVFHFSLRDAADRMTANSFLESCLSTNRFARNEKGTVVYSPTGIPDDWVPVTRAAEFRALLEQEDILRIEGDQNADAFFTLWTFLNDRRGRLPRINPSRPYSPPQPLPMRSGQYQAPALGGRK